MTPGQQVAADLDRLARFRAAHPDVPVITKAQCPYAWPPRTGRLEGRDLHDLLDRLDAFYRPGSAR